MTVLVVSESSPHNKYPRIYVKPEDMTDIAFMEKVNDLYVDEYRNHAEVIDPTKSYFDKGNRCGEITYTDGSKNVYEVVEVEG